jgi:hypothetical protein
MNERSWDNIKQTLINIRTVEESFAKIQENPALYGAEYGLTNQGQELLEKLITLSGETSFIGSAILKRAFPQLREKKNEKNT